MNHTKRIERIQVSSRVNNSYSTKQGFSLLELLIVVVIIAVLAGIAVPVYRNNVEKAKRTEIAVTMGYVKSQLNIYYAEYGEYPIAPTWENVVGSDWNYIPTGGLRGKYFLSKYYDYRSEDGVQYRIRCYWNEGRDANFWVDEVGNWSWEIPEADW